MTTYLAAEDSAMDRRSRGLHRFLVSSPVVLLIAISAVGHLRKPAHLGAAGTADYDRRVLAYRDRVVAVEHMANMDDKVDATSLETEAQKWADGYRTGVLTPLRPAAYEDHLRDGVRGEVLNAGLLLSSKVSLRARNELNQGSYAQAAHDSLLATEIVLGMRGFELEAYLLCVHSAKRSLDPLETAWPHLSVQQRQELKPRLSALKVDPEEQSALIALDDNLIKDYFARQGHQNSVARQSNTALARQRDQSSKTAEKITSLYSESLQKLIGSSNEASAKS